MADLSYLVVGGRGLVGRAVVELLHERGIPVTAISRQARDVPSGAVHLRLDLSDRAACAAALVGLRRITHVVYAALYEKPDLIAGWRDAEQIDTNAAMLRNLLDHLRPLAHVSLLQGTKAYGAHVAPMKLPGKETDPRRSSWCSRCRAWRRNGMKSSGYTNWLRCRWASW